MTKSKTEKKVSISILAIVGLLLCLTVTTAALAYVSVNLDNNAFQTGRVSINLNNGEPVIREGDYLFEPGMTVKKEFTLSNSGTCAVWFRFWFDVDQDAAKMSEAIDVSILDEDTVLFNGKMADMTQSNAPSCAPPSEVQLETGEERTLSILFRMADGTGNGMKNASLSFDFVADAVQADHNENREFHD